ncbi:unnamed protein product [Nippostrongylus brasiliensis]|uniref:Aldehyde dehydrogenase family 8 member A1 (inferred by orthology to a human protein) n=1 Tax=Nippostrongylus brasiliensis TaxID=27835 RepID=A0A0N4Y364_NIPBR|nr:unnamed protein product [Nippostrongylus brasiliensis]
MPVKDVVDRLVSSSNGEHEPLTNFINNEFVKSKQTLSSINPATANAWIEIPDSNSEDVDRAVSAAKRAFVSWSSTSAQYRSGLLLKLADIIEQNLEGLSILESRDQGKPVKLARYFLVRNIIFNVESNTNRSTRVINFRSTIIDEPIRAVNYVKNDPVGVAGLISPWNLPLYLLSFKLAPALATGNTVVFKPSELTSVTAWVLMHAVKQAGFPPGVVNMVIGTGQSAGQALVEHPDVPLISFTGSTLVGKKIAELCAKLNKKVSLEMGGKNAAIIYPSCDLAKHLPSITRSCFINQGEICLCTSRIFVHSSIYDNFVEQLVREAKKYTVGNPKDDVTLGAVNSKAHFEKVIIRFDEEEIFGPVVCVTAFDSSEEVISRANATPYGLSATVWSENNEELINTAHGLRVGTVWCNTWLTRDLNMPFGGTKESGMGREGALDSFHFFTEQKTVCIRL